MEKKKITRRHKIQTSMMVSSKTKLKYVKKILFKQNYKKNLVTYLAYEADK